MEFSPTNDPTAGQVTVSGAGTAVQGPDVEGHLWALAAHPGNSGTAVWVGNTSGSVSATTGFPLRPTGPVMVFVASNMNALYFDADADGDKACYFRLDGP